MTPQEIANQMMEESTPDESGWTAYGRMEYVMRVMDFEEIDLATPFDYSCIIDCGIIEVVHAAGHLASLQLNFLERCFEQGLVGDGTYTIEASQLTLDIDRITWHADHLMQGIPTPSYFPFMN